MIEVVTRTYVTFYGSNNVSRTREITSREEFGEIPAWCQRYATFERQESKWGCGLANDILKGEPRNHEYHEPNMPEVKGKLDSELPPPPITREMLEVIERGKIARGGKDLEQWLARKGSIVTID